MLCDEQWHQCPYCRNATVQIRITHMLVSSRQDLSLCSTVGNMDEDLDVLREGLGYLREFGNACPSQLSKSTELPIYIITWILRRHRVSDKLFA